MAPLDRNQRARFRYLLHAHRRARRLTRAGLDVGEALVKRLGENGRLDPSYATLAKDADCCARTVQRACDTMRGLGLLRWTRRLVRNGPYVEQSSNAYELTPAGTAATLPPGGTRIGDGQKGRQTSFVDITYCPPPHEIAAAQAALASARARAWSKGCSGMDAGWFLPPNQERNTAKSARARLPLPGVAAGVRCGGSLEAQDGGGRRWFVGSLGQVR